MSTWEERMSERAHSGDVGVKERTERWMALMDIGSGTTEPWLHGWPRMSLTSVLIGSGVHCVGCGKDYGITTVAIDPDWTPPTQDPDWPFAEESCPVHMLADFAGP